MVQGNSHDKPAFLFEFIVNSYLKQYKECHQYYNIPSIGPPNLQDNLVLNIAENTVSVPVELRQGPAAFPEPTLYSWTKDGVTFNNPTLTYSSVTFSPLRRSDTGVYLVSATNYILGSNTEQVGNDTGSFFLNVICELAIADFVISHMTSFYNCFQMGHPSKSLGLLKSMHSIMKAYPLFVALVWTAILQPWSPGPPLMEQL